jgi:hypothetical protein
VYDGAARFWSRRVLPRLTLPTPVVDDDDDSQYMWASVLMGNAVKLIDDTHIQHGCPGQKRSPGQRGGDSHVCDARARPGGRFQGFLGGRGMRLRMRKRRRWRLHLHHCLHRQRGLSAACPPRWGATTRGMGGADGRSKKSAAVPAKQFISIDCTMMRAVDGMKQRNVAGHVPCC